MSVTIYHNPACGQSRKTLALIREAGIEPRIVEYLKAPPGREALEALAARIEGGARALLRTKELLYADLGLDDPSLSESWLIETLLAHPRLLNRPVVESPRGVAVCRPPERVKGLL